MVEALTDRQPELVAVFVTFLFLGLSASLCRLYTRAFIIKRFVTEDWLALLLLVIYITYTVIALLGVWAGFGKHVADVAPAQRIVAVRWRFVDTPIYEVASALTKTIVCLQLLRIFPRQTRACRVFVWCILALVAVVTAFTLVLTIAACRPLEYSWTRYETPPPPGGRCNSGAFALWIVYSSIFANIAVDWVLAILPAYLVWNMKMDKNTKRSVWFVLSMGSLASIATVARLPYTREMLDSADYLYDFTDYMIWTAVEIGMATTASALATLKPLFRKIRFLPMLRSLCSCAASCCCAPAGSGYAGLEDRAPRGRRPRSSKESAAGSSTAPGSSHGARLSRETAVSRPGTARGGARAGPWAMPSSSSSSSSCAVGGGDGNGSHDDAGSDWYGDDAYEDIEMAMSSPRPLPPAQARVAPSPGEPVAVPLPAAHGSPLSAPRLPPLPVAPPSPSLRSPRSSLSTIYEQAAVRRTSSQVSSSSSQWKRAGRLIGNGPGPSWQGAQGEANGNAV